MSKSLRFCWVALLLAGSGVPQAFAPPSGKTWSVKSSGETIASARIGGVRVTMAVTNSQAAFGADQFPVPSYGQCQYFPRPCSVTRRIVVARGVTALAIPENAYTDLADIHAMSLGGTLGRLIATFSGGDAADSYNATLIFNRDRLIERLLYYGPDDSRPIEVSYYHTVVLN